MIFGLPPQTIVNKVIPKNAFDTYTTAKQKKKLAELVERIRWTNKLSPETINLSGKNITEIQVFEIELRKQEEIEDLLNVFDKAIPYPIVFFIFYGNNAYLRASKKHIHPTQEDISVIDWTFKTEWMKREGMSFSFDLKKNLDYVLQNFCNHLSSGFSNANSLDQLVAFEQEFWQLRNAIEKLKTSIKRSTPFKKKVELNQQLKRLESQLSELKKTNAS